MKLYENTKSCYICEEKFENKYLKIKNIVKLKISHYSHYREEYRGSAHSICNLKYRLPKSIPIVFHNESNYDYHFTIKDLAEEFKKQFPCL